jgi:serpin B
MKDMMKTIFWGIILCSGLLLLSQCKTNKHVSNSSSNSEKADSNVVWENNYMDDSDYDIIYENNSFAFELFKKIDDNPKNVLFSPYSISSALAMTYAGAREETALQMSKTMHYSLSQQQLHEGFRNLNRDIQPGEDMESCELHSANALWLQEKYGILDNYYKICQKYYGAAFHYTDFINQPEKSRANINKWVEDKTNEKIKDLIPKNAISDLTRMILTNAIYFYGKWATPFEKKHTEKADFYLSDGTTVLADFMNHPKKRFLYYEDSLFQILEMPYEGDKYAMSIFLPTTGKSLTSLDQLLQTDQLKQLQRKMKAYQLEVLIPRFQFSYAISLEKTLSEMGMPIAFSNAADFSGMTGQKDLKIDKVIHKAFIEVNEEGTEAAAATAVIMVERSTYMPDKKVFNANRPFAFIIQDKESGSILFMGKVLDPTKE